MCGIVAILEVGGAGSVSRALLDRMAQAIAHRGPDERGLWVEGPIGLAAQRLRVVDLATGQQPLANEDGGIRADPSAGCRERNRAAETCRNDLP